MNSRYMVMTYWLSKAWGVVPCPSVSLDLWVGFTTFRAGKVMLEDCRLSQTLGTNFTRAVLKDSENQCVSIDDSEERWCMQVIMQGAMLYVPKAPKDHAWLWVPNSANKYHKSVIQDKDFQWISKNHCLSLDRMFDSWNLIDLLYVSMDFNPLLGEKRRNFLMLVQGW
jgi:hypothetical protein